MAGLFVGFFGWLLGRWRGILAAFLVIALFAFLAGLARAWCSRREYGLNSLAFVAALMALANPHVLWDFGSSRTTGSWLVGCPQR